MKYEDILTKIQSLQIPELCEIAVLRTEDTVLHPLTMLTLEVAKAAAQQIVLIVKAVATTLVMDQS